MALTLAEARTLVAHHLDDANNRRWSTAQIDIALQGAVSLCVSDYLAAGGRQLAEEASVTTSAGSVSLSSQAPSAILGVQILSGDRYYRVRPAIRADREVVDAEARSLRVEFTREFTIPTTTSHQLIGDGATAKGAWPALEQWVCARAAAQLGVKDNDRRPGLDRLAQEYATSVLSRLNSPRARPLPEEGWAHYIDWLAWVYDPATTTLSLVRATGGLW